MPFTKLAIAFLSTFIIAHADEGSFSYDPSSSTGPASWGDLALEGNQCNGQKNSPIAVQSRPCDRFEDYVFMGGSCPIGNMTYSLTPTGMKAEFPGVQQCEHPTVQIPGIEGTYRAAQFHIHTSSEHTIDGQFFGAELHVVHQEVDGERYAVVGMMIQPTADAPNEIFDGLLNAWEDIMVASDSQCAIARGGERKLTEKKNRQLQSDVFSPYDLLAEDSTFFHYDGGLTTPPCSEVVWWNLADKPVSITPAQYTQLVTQVVGYLDPSTCEPGTYAGPAGSTSRPTQPLNGRVVERICPVGYDDASAAKSDEVVSNAGSVSIFFCGCTCWSCNVAVITERN